ncbi:MAG: DUF58 domain-containing protein [Armatimonadota bacterium]
MPVWSTLGRIIFLFGLCFFLIGFIHAAPLMYMVAAFCFSIFVIAIILAWRSLRDIDCRRDLTGSTVFSGDPLESTITIAERKSRWRMLEVLDRHINTVTDQVTRRRMTLLTEGGDARSAMVAGVRQSVRVDLQGNRLLVIRDVIRFSRRGLYRLGPLTIQGHDPFGLLYVSRSIPLKHDIIVYPRPLPMPELVLGGLGGRQTTEVRPMGHAGESADFHGIRPYVQGDDLRRVHWKATAHTGKLAIKEYEYRFSGAVQVILDLQKGVHVGDRDFSTLEAAITLAVSVLKHVLDRGNQAGLLATGAQVLNLPGESGERQMHRALEALALAKDDGAVPLAKALASGEAQPARRNTVIVITPTVDRSVIGPLLALHGRSAQVLLVLIDQQSFYEAEMETRRSRNPLLSLVRGGPLERPAPTRRDIPTTEEHRFLLSAAAAAGIEVFPITANLPLHQALQGIRMRM